MASKYDAARQQFGVTPPIQSPAGNTGQTVSPGASQQPSKYDSARAQMGITAGGTPQPTQTQQSQPQQTPSKYDAARMKVDPNASYSGRPLTADQQHALEVEQSDQAQMDQASHGYQQDDPGASDSLSREQLQPKKETFLMNPIGYTLHHIPGFQFVDRASAALAAAMTPDAPYIGKSDNLFDGPNYVSGPTAKQVAEQQVQDKTTGNATADKVADFIGHTGALMSPIPGMSPVINEAYAGVRGIAGATRAGAAVDNLIGRAGAGAANVVNPALNQIGINVGTDFARSAAQHAAQGAVSGGAYGAVAPFIGGSNNPADVPRSVLENAAMFGAGDGALYGLGAGAKAGVDAIRNRAAFKQAIDDFVQRTAAKPEPSPAAPVPDYSNIELGRSNPGITFKPSDAEVTPGAFPQDRIVQDTGMSPAASRADEFAANFKRGEDYQAQYKQAVQDQYNYLKQSMDQRGGVEPGGLIKDPTTGEVINRYGRTSNNPKWYQDFYAENGRKPTEADLRKLSEQHVQQGFQDESGQVPAWKPDPIQEIDQELQSIREAMPSANAETRKSLEQTAATLQKSRNELKQSLPEGVQAMEAGGPAADGVQNYAGNHMTFREPVAQTSDTISRNQVVKNLRNNLGVPIDTGRLIRAGRGTLGQYKNQAQVVRTRMAEDLQTISHEVGHHLDRKHDLAQPQFQTEFMRILQNNPVLDLSKYQPHQLPKEGVAEYVRLRLTDPATARQLAPQFSRYFDSKLPPKVLQGLEASQRDIDTWISQGEYEQAKGLIDFESGTRKESFNKDKVYTKFVDDLNPLKLAEKALKGAVGVGRESIYKMARLSRGISQRAELAVMRGIYDAAGNKVSDGLRQIVKPLEDLGIKEKDFATYLAVKHSIDLKSMGKQVPFTDGQIKAVLSRLDTPEVQAVQQQIIKYNDALMDVLVDAQIIDPVSVTMMRRKYPNYVPLMRFFEDDAAAGFKNGGFGAAKGFANITNPVKVMSEEGSTRTIINPVESMVKNTFLVMNAAAKNKVGLQLADLSRIEGAGAWAEHVGEGGASPHEHVISVYENGARQSYKVRNPELYNAMLSLDTESTNSLIKFLGGAASLLRAGATLTPDFMIRNAMRDIVGNTVNSTKYGFNPLTIFSGMFHMISPRMGGSSQVFDQFLSSGGAMGTLMSLDRDANREALQKVFRQSLADKTMNVITSPKELAKLLSGYTPAKTVVGALRKGSEFSELATRVGAFSKALNKTGNLEEAAYTARDLMDFNRAGSAIRQANRAVAFMNANIQGVDRMARAFKDNPASFLVRAFTTLVMPAAGIYYWNQHLPEEQRKVYDNIPQWQKDSFFIIGVPGTKLFARIPKPFEAGVLFATGTERALDWFQGHNPEAFKAYGKSVLSAMTPPMLFTALTPLLEATTNHSFFRNAPIVPQGEQNREKPEQYGIFTSETAKLIGKIMGQTWLKNSNFASPRIIDNTIKGYTAGLGGYAVSGADTAINAVQGGPKVPLPEKSLLEHAPFSSFLATTSGGGQIRQDFYDKWDEVSKAKNTADRNSTVMADPSSYMQLKSGKSVMDKLNHQYKQVQQDPNMNPKTKRDQLDKLDTAMNEVAAKSLGK